MEGGRVIKEEKWPGNLEKGTEMREVKIKMERGRGETRVKKRSERKRRQRKGKIGR